jgi:hypothetical protein
MRGPVQSVSWTRPDYNRKEILRYAGAREATPEVAELMESCIREVDDELLYRVCWTEFPIREDGQGLDLGFGRCQSASLARNLSGCDHIVLFAATVGVGLDRLIARYKNLSPARALMFQAIGAERIEELCDAFNARINEEKGAQGRATRPRYSPGYGDLPLQMQTDIFAVLDCPRQIGLTLNDSLLMSPSKSVTAIIGVVRPGEDPRPGRAVPSGCAACDSPSCTMRRTT